MNGAFNTGGQSNLWSFIGFPQKQSTYYQS
jgi:hypothetical protein